MHYQTELPIKIKPVTPNSSEVRQELGEQLNKMQSDLENLSQSNAEIFNMVYEQQELSSTTKIEALKQQLTLLEKGVIKIYQHLEKDNTGKELKSGQQTLKKAIETNQKKSADSVSYLDWKQLTIIITATALISSLCSFAIFQMASNWKADQPQSPVEKPLKIKSKKSSK